MLKQLHALQIKLASSEEILAWSRGEVKKSETINYRTQKAEPQGLMCEAIFGPAKNYECYCGKYRKIRYKGIVCDKCGVEVTLKKVRRERIGHISLAAPVTHIWYAHGTPNKLALILDIPQGKLDSVIYFSRHLITGIDEEKRETQLEKLAQMKVQSTQKVEASLQADIEKLEKEARAEIKEATKAGNDMKVMKLNQDLSKKIANLKSTVHNRVIDTNKDIERAEVTLNSFFVGEVVTEDDINLLRAYEIDCFEAGIGAEAIFDLLKKLDNNIEEVLEKLLERKEKVKSALIQKKLVERYRLLKSMHDEGIKASWIVMSVVPVLPADLRPIVQLPGGRYASSDLNDLYRRVINRNNRLKRLVELGAPELILRNEKRMLQESVDVLFDNSHRSGQAILNTRGQPYKSLSDTLRGKSGRFRQNLLGKRVDYSGRAVIVGGPELAVNECGLPKNMAIELFKPYIIHEIIIRGYSANTKSAKTFFDQRPPEVYDILEDVIKGRPVLLNRAPTLHKQGILAFFPILTDGNAIRLNPLVCKGFNADFDGDQMAVHLPLSIKAQQEAIEHMMPDSNILLMRDGSPIITANKDMVTGCYYMTLMPESDDVQVFADANAVLRAYDLGEIKHDQPVKTIIKDSIKLTSAGRIIFNQILPAEYEYQNKTFDQSAINALIADIFVRYGAKDALFALDGVKHWGVTFLTKSGLSIGISDYIMSPNRMAMIDESNDKEEQLNEMLKQGLISESERPKLSQKIWNEVADKMTIETLALYKDTNPLILLDKSGGLPAKDPLKSSVVMKGMIADVHGKAIELPLRSNYVLGFNTFEFFVSARGTRKGEADKALKTSASGYLTRKLCDVGQAQITNLEDCGTTNGITVSRNQSRRLSFEKRIAGRFSVNKIVNPSTGEMILPEQTLIDSKFAKMIDSIPEITEVKVRSPLTCDSVEGLCCKCYGFNLGTQRVVERGVAVGIIAGQAMGESSTQLTMNSKHSAARLGATDITQGLPRIEELYECRTPKSKALIAKISGDVTVTQNDKTDIFSKILRISNSQKVEKKYVLRKGDEVMFSRSKKVKKGEELVKMADGSLLLAPIDGNISKVEDTVAFAGELKQEAEYEITKEMALRVMDGDKVNAGDQLTEGAMDPKDLMSFVDIHRAEQYLINNIQEVYGNQGIALDDKHMETIVRVMGGFVKIVDPGDSLYIPGDIVSFHKVRNANLELKQAEKKTIKYVRLLLGITNAAIKTESFLSAASFQEQVPVLSEAALRGDRDYLKGLKENVIIGRRVPLGHSHFEHIDETENN